MVGEKCLGDGRSGRGRLGFGLTLGVGQDLAELREEVEAFGFERK
jgi:hypothetical protein